MGDKVGEDFLKIKQTLLDAVKYCDKIGNREEIKRLILEQLEKMDGADGEYKQAMRDLKIDRLLETDEDFVKKHNG